LSSMHKLKANSRRLNVRLTPTGWDVAVYSTEILPALNNSSRDNQLWSSHH